MKNTRNVTNLIGKISLLLVLVCASKIAFGQTSQPTKATNLGIVSELTFYKLSAENLAISILNDTTVSKVSKFAFLQEYNELKIVSDQILLQLIADLKRRNRIKYYKKLDDLYTQSSIAKPKIEDVKIEKVKSYVYNLMKVDTTFKSVLDRGKSIMADIKESNPNKAFITTPSLAELTGALGFFTATIKDIRESREKKVEKICVILNDLRLKAVQDLLKKEEKKEEKK
jgi:hypothetical protein